MSNEQLLAEMDAAANQAEREFGKLKTAHDVAQWWTKWYLRAGHKRLGRVLVRIIKEEK